MMLLEILTRYAQSQICERVFSNVKVCKYDVNKNTLRITSFTSMDNPAAMQVRDSTYYLCEELLCYVYRVPFLAVFRP
jgi:hypothetical protein